MKVVTAKVRADKARAGRISWQRRLERMGAKAISERMRELHARSEYNRLLRAQATADALARLAEVEAALAVESDPKIAARR